MSAVSISGVVATLTLAESIPHNEIVAAAYYPPRKCRLSDRSCRIERFLIGVSVLTPDTTPPDPPDTTSPMFVRSKVVTGARRDVTAGGVAMSAKTVTLTLTSAVSEGDNVTVRYTRPSTGPCYQVIQAASHADLDGHLHLSFSLAKAIPRDLTLEVDRRQFRVAVATLSSDNKTATWRNIDFYWTTGQKVSLRLTASPGSGTNTLVFTHKVVQPNYST